VEELKSQLRNLYLEERTKFTQEIFWDFNMLVEVRHDTIPMNWETNPLDLNLEGIEFLSFTPGEGHSMRAIYRDPVTRVAIPVTKDIYVAIFQGVKAQAFGKFFFI
jgi:hypothetical protein